MKFCMHSYCIMLDVKKIYTALLKHGVRITWTPQNVHFQLHLGLKICETLSLKMQNLVC